MMLSNALLHVVDPQGKQRASGAFAGLAKQESEMIQTINSLRDCAAEFGSPGHGGDISGGNRSEAGTEPPGPVDRTVSVAMHREIAGAKESSGSAISNFVRTLDTS